MLEYIGLGWLPNLLYNLGKDVFGWRKPLSSEERIARRRKWKPMFDEHIRDHFSRKLRSDVIIRDVKRVDQYPDIEEKSKGISPWFRVGLVGTYHRGILVAFHWLRLVHVGDEKFRVLDILDHDKDDKSLEADSIKAIQLGMIPFENIEEVDFEGDEYYGFPHIYCHFSNKREPYERIAIFTQNQLFPDSLPYYSEIADVESVRKESEKAGIKKPYL